MMSVYVAGPYIRAPYTRSIHELLREQGLLITSSWAEQATGPEDSFASVHARRAIAAANDRDLRASDVILVADPDCLGKETLCELRLALEWGKAAIVYGPELLSVSRRGVVRADDLDDAIAVLVEMKAAYEAGYRGTMLADFVRNAGSDRGAA